MVERRIKQAAILWTDGKVYTVTFPDGRYGRHHDIIHHMVFDLGAEPPVNREQGFITEAGEFVDREHAAIIALLAGQVKLENLRGGALYSEDIY